MSEKTDPRSSETSGQTAPGAGAAPPRRRVAAVAAVVVLCLGGAAAGLLASGSAGALFGGYAETVEAVSPSDAPSAVADDTERHDPLAQATADKDVELIEIPDMLVNIVGSAGGGRKKSKFLKISVALAVSKESMKVVEDRRAYLKDAFQDFLRQLDEAEIEGTAGLIRLRAELLKRARATVGVGVVSEVLVSDILVQ